MSINTKFKNIAIVEQGLILQYGNNEERKISFSEIENIYVKVYKLRPIQELGLILFPFFLIFLSVQYFALEKVIVVGLSVVIPVLVKMNNYKSYGLVLCLKNGTVFRKKVSIDIKGKYISIVNAVRKEQLNHYAKTNAPHELGFA